jgi:hypothetical protein
MISLHLLRYVSMIALLVAFDAGGDAAGRNDATISADDSEETGLGSLVQWESPSTCIVDSSGSVVQCFEWPWFGMGSH